MKYINRTVAFILLLPLLLPLFTHALAVTTEAEDAAQNIPMFRQWLKSVVVAE